MTITFIVLALIAAGSDIVARRVPNRLNLLIFVTGLGGRMFFDGWQAALLGFAGALLGLALLMPPFAARWLGAGDVKLMAALGAWLGPVNTAWACLFGVVGGGLLGLGFLVFCGARLRREVWSTMKNAAYTMSSPEVPKRERKLTLPLAVPYAASAIVMYLVFPAGDLLW